MIFKRDLSDSFARFLKFPVIAVLGPRQSGKTTLVKEYFSNHIYLNFEKPSVREEAKNDPEQFLKRHANQHGIILDEFQYVPEIMSYIQLESDEKKLQGYFILTGSSNYLMNESITQSLAGRIAILTLLPLSISELEQDWQATTVDTNTVDKLILQGGYPRLHEQNIAPDDLYPSYIHSYLERDVRHFDQVPDLNTFQLFMKLCAARVGQLLNIDEIAMNCGVDSKTINRWLSILSAGYIVFLQQPYFKNFNKRITKTAKLYFYDTGIACSLLGLKTEQELFSSYLRGALFENLMIADFYKQYYQLGTTPNSYFWRDQNGRVEIDCLLEQGSVLVPIELKSSMTIQSSFFSQLELFKEISGNSASQAYVVYAGDEVQERSQAIVVGWKQAGNLIKQLESKRK
jgi:uncharacterized protein